MFTLFVVGLMLQMAEQSEYQSLLAVQSSVNSTPYVQSYEPIAVQDDEYVYSYPPSFPYVYIAPNSYLRWCREHHRSPHFVKPHVHQSMVRKPVQHGSQSAQRNFQRNTRYTYRNTQSTVHRSVSGRQFYHRSR